MGLLFDLFWITIHAWLFEKYEQRRWRTMNVPHYTHLHPGDLVYIPYDPFVADERRAGPAFIVSIEEKSRYNDYGYEVYRAYVLMANWNGITYIPGHLLKLNA